MDGSAHIDVIRLGDPVPRFSAPTLSGGQVDLHVDAGRWVALAFLGPSEDPRTNIELAHLLAQAQRFNDHHLVLYIILSTPPADPARLASFGGSGLTFVTDYDGRLAASYGAWASPRTIVLDSLQRAIANIAWADDPNHAQTVAGLFASLPPVDQSVGVKLTAPILIVPRVFEFDICDFMVQVHQQLGGTPSGFLKSRDGHTATVLDPRYKSRTDYVIGDPELRAILADRVQRRVVPLIEQVFHYPVTRMDRTMVCCYAAEEGGHFYRHRDNLLPGSRHRRFAMSINLNDDFDGGDVVFPEWGATAYRPPVGGAVVFSTALLHQVTPVTRGRRYVFVPFLYGEADVATRLADNDLIERGCTTYADDGNDLLVPS